MPSQFKNEQINNSYDDEEKSTWRMNTIYGGVFIFIAMIGLVVLGMWGCPQYKVYSERKEGEALLAHSVAAKEVLVNEAKAKMESAAYLSQADTLRAIGIARTNQIIGTSLSDKYLQWLWISNLKEQDKTVIYVQSGAMGMPIMEAGRLVPPLVVPNETTDEK